MPLKIFNGFSQTQDPGDFQRVVAAWAKKVVSEINDVISQNISGNSSSISNINGDITTINNSVSTINQTLASGAYNGHNIIVSNTNDAINMAMLFGVINGFTDTILYGVGFSLSHTGTGVYDINFTTAFGSLPVCTASITTVGSVTVLPLGVSLVRIQVFTSAGGPADTNILSFMVAGRMT